MDALLRTVPVWKSADAVVVGSSSAAVAACLEFHDRGMNALLVAEGAGLGSDLADTFQLWDPPADDPFLRPLMVSESGFSGRPGALRHRLEMELIQRNIPFVFHARPVLLLRDPAGLAAGLVLAAKTALFAVSAGRVIDCTPAGSVARLSGTPLSRRPGKAKGFWRILADEPPRSWPGEVREAGIYRQRVRDMDFEHRILDLCFEDDDDPRSLVHRLRCALDTESLHAASALPVVPCAEVRADRPINGALGSLVAADAQTEAGVWMAGGLLPFSDPRHLCDPAAMGEISRQVARWAFDAPAAKPGQLGSAGGALAALPAFLRNPLGEVSLPGDSLPDLGSFDVVVTGGGTGGAPAAIAAAEAGATTLCLESGHTLGGVGTLGLISSYWFGNRCGFTAKLDQALAGADPLCREKSGSRWNPELKSNLYHRLLAAHRATVWTHSQVAAVRMENQRVTAVLAVTGYGCGWVRAGWVVDATGNSDIAAAAGASFRVIDSSHVAVQGTGISPRVHPAATSQNSDHTFVDDNDPEGRTWAHVQARRKYPDDFDTAPFLNSRERRQIAGEYEVSPVDILAGRVFPDTVLTARSNFDTHGFIIHPVFMVVPPDKLPLAAHVPLRCMIPKGVNGVLVTGLGMCAHRDALPVLRMQADVQNQGHAAGWLAAYFVKTRRNPGETPTADWQSGLVQSGILADEVAGQPDSFPLSDDTVRKAALGSLESACDVAIVMAHPETALPVIASRWTTETHSATRRRCVLILGLLGHQAATPGLLEWLAGAEDWDEGWDFRGMGQFGRSMSDLDAAILAAARCGAGDCVPDLVRLAALLDESAAFSHCRSLALAAALLKDPRLNSALGRLIDLPGFTGHDQTTPEALLEDSDPSPVSTSSRNLSLREIYTARGLFLGTGRHSRAQAILESYAMDLRGHFARHARSILAEEVSGSDLA